MGVRTATPSLSCQPRASGHIEGSEETIRVSFVNIKIASWKDGFWKGIAYSFDCSRERDHSTIEIPCRRFRSGNISSIA